MKSTLKYKKNIKTHKNEQEHELKYDQNSSQVQIIDNNLTPIPQQKGEIIKWY